MLLATAARQVSESSTETIADTPAPRRGGFWLRGLAFALDLGSVALACHVAASLVAVFGDLDRPFRMYLEPEVYAYRLLWYMAAGQAAAVLVYPLYAALFLASPLGASPGKLTVRLYVVDAQGRRLGFWRALAREAAKWLSLATLTFGFLMAAWTRRKLALHDLVAGTRVLRQPRRAQVAPVAAADNRAPPAAAPISEIRKLAYVLAGLGAIPVLGWPFGVAGLIWGLSSRRRHAKRVAAIAAICTLGVSLFYSGVYYFFISDFLQRQQEMQSTAQEMIWTRNELVRAACHLELFHRRYGRYPRDLRELYVAQHELDLWLSIEDQLAWNEKDPAPPLYVYRPGGDGYRLFSAGRDGEAETEDDVSLPERWRCPEFNPLRAPELDRRRKDDA